MNPLRLVVFAIFSQIDDEIMVLVEIRGPPL